MNAIPSLGVLLVLSAPSLAGPLEKGISSTIAKKISCSATKSEKVRIVDEDGKPVYTSGRVELNTKGKWEPVCAFNFFNKEAKSVCGSLCESGAKPMSLEHPSGWSAKAPMEILRCDPSSTDINGCKNIPTEKVPRQMYGFCRRQAAYVRCVDKKEVPKELNVDVKCESGIATMSINESTLQGVTESRFIISNSGISNRKKCFSNVTRLSDSVLFTFTFLHCGGSVALYNGSISYENILIVESPVKKGIILNANVTFLVICNVTSSKEMTIGNVSGMGKALRIKSVDNPNVFMKMFSDKEMKKPVIPGHKMVVLASTRIYTRVEDESPEITTAMAVRKCWLTPVPDKDSKQKLVLIDNGCQNPTYVKEMRYLSHKKQTFVFQPVLFEGYNTFYLHCKANTCDETDLTEKCMRWCINPADAFKGRGKRSTNLELPEASTKRSAGSRTYLLNNGPFYSLN